MRPNGKGTHHGNQEGRPGVELGQPGEAYRHRTGDRRRAGRGGAEHRGRRAAGHAVRVGAERRRADSGVLPGYQRACERSRSRIDENRRAPVRGEHVRRGARGRGGQLPVPHRAHAERSGGRPELAVGHRGGAGHARDERGVEPGGRAYERELHRHPGLGRGAGHRAARRVAEHEGRVRQRVRRRVAGGRAG